MEGIYCNVISSVLLWYQFSLHFHSVYASVIIAALIVRSAQETAAECATNCQDRLGRNSMADFDNDCHRGVQHSYVDCLASGSCLSTSNIKTSNTTYAGVIIIKNSHVCKLVFMFCLILLLLRVHLHYFLQPVEENKHGEVDVAI